VDNLANFISTYYLIQVQFLSSLEDVFEEMNFKDKKISDLKKTLIEHSDFTIKLQVKYFFDVRIKFRNTKTN
jgi:hypothetical protein